ncbi:ABC transporter substrate-binding protein [Phaeovulum vinaykumarii]|uniref:Amino acid/amide ABC transporter substrate-binding protein, HAAT family n=1 Tax=Phaeovulum vinaykumarii TaxID=407234 RepID=A0A1N7MLH3_9RHOB|nr:ABC transporter substrate-binding protein [Phaeovulum vinaykumarii]SIS86947.1 amino acid/amide ABC transporter substrate-binding protein, HAAT family [Phaeovulum vinaykumarii]SOC13363.1 amino acid/amide ABC transporter substrate-binding protein (HAAT family) [Phaeovulum vinaykumarii]
MKSKFTTAVVTAIALAGPAMADLVVPNLSYRTGAYAANGIPYADGFNDYFTLLNERDGGIGGEIVQVPECETAYNTEKGVECYESTKGMGALAYNPLSTGITYQLIPKVTADGITLYTPGYGRTSAANGSVFEWVFNYPANYWDGASVAIKYLLDENGGDLAGKKVTLLYHNSAYGKEPIRTLQALSEKHGFELQAVPVDHPGQEQKSQWLQIRRDKPDYVLMWGWGVMNQVAIQEAVNIRYPMDHFIGIWWSGSENDVKPAGDGANGYKALTMHGTGMDYPIYADIQKYVVDAGKAAGAGDMVGTVLYSRGMYAAMVIAEAIRKGQEIHGTSAVNAAQVRDGFENLEITEERMAELGLPQFGPPFAASCTDHGGPGAAMIQQWDAAAGTWNSITGFIAPDDAVLDPLVAEDSAAFAAENNITPRCQ